MSCSNQIICYTSPHLSLHVPFFFLLIILTHCYVIVYSFYYPPLQAYLQYKKSLSNIIHLSHRQIQVCLTIYIDAKIDPKVSYYDYIIAYLYPFVSFQRREFTISQHFQIANLFVSKEIGLYLNLSSGIFLV